MIRTRGQKVLGELWERKGRTAMASMAIFIGVFGVVALVSMGDILTKSFLKDYQEHAIAMQEVTLALPGDPEVDNAAYLATLKALPGIENVEGRVSAQMLWKKLGAEKYQDGFMVAAWEPFGSSQIEPTRLVDGQFPMGGQNQLAIERRMADAHGLGIGDKLIIAVFGAGGMQEETWEIVGIVFQAYLEGIPGFSPAEAAVFPTYDDAQHLLGEPGLTSLVARYADFAAAEQLADNFTATIDEQTPYLSIGSFTVDPAVAIQEQQQTSSILAFLAIIAMVVSGFLVLNIVNTIVVEQRQQIGVMKSLGATRTDNLLMYMGIALSYGVIGTIPAIILGAIVGAGAAVNLGPLFNTFIDDPGVSVTGRHYGPHNGIAGPATGSPYSRDRWHPRYHPGSHDRPGHLGRLRKRSCGQVGARAAAADQHQAGAQQHDAQKGTAVPDMVDADIGCRGLYGRPGLVLGVGRTH